MLGLHWRISMCALEDARPRSTFLEKRRYQVCISINTYKRGSSSGEIGSLTLEDAGDKPNIYTQPNVPVLTYSEVYVSLALLTYELKTK